MPPLHFAGVGAHLLTNTGIFMFNIECLEENLEVDSVYTDGGIIGKNPSEIGGTWAAVFVFQDKVVAERSGVILPADIGMDTVENNIAETIAILLALEALPFGWNGMVYGDNLNSIRRARDLKIKDAVPKFIKDRLLAVRLDKSPGFTLLGGHPTKAEVEAGRRADGKLVSKWNVLADKLCCKSAASHLGRTA